MPEESQQLSLHFCKVRRQSETFCKPLAIEDYGLQAVAETSPAKWHLAHTSWFFETFLLQPFATNYQVFNAQFAYLFNSYYNGIGSQYPRSKRGLLSRPVVEEVYRYRQHVDQAMLALLNCPHPAEAEIHKRVQLGIHHEQQHQELFFTDLKYNLFQNPLYPAYCTSSNAPHQNSCATESELEFIPFNGGLVTVGCEHENAFHFDNETPQHSVYLQPFTLANRLISNSDFLQFIEDDGYQRPELWLSDGWSCVQEQQWQHPLYWLKRDGQWLEFTLSGLRPLQAQQPVSHVSAYEADAYARWANARLPTEFEWEHAARQTEALAKIDSSNDFVASQHFHPQGNKTSAGLQQMFGQCWQWTSSAYSPYPGFKPAAGAIGEYNGKFMCNQLVLRGASCITDEQHARLSYRNFFYPADRWQFSAIRLAKDS